MFPKNPSFSARSAQGKRLSLFRRDILVEKPFDRSLNLLLFLLVDEKPFDRARNELFQ